MEPTAETATAEDAAFREVMDDLFLDDAEADQLATLYESAITAAEARAEAKGRTQALENDPIVVSLREVARLSNLYLADGCCEQHHREVWNKLIDELHKFEDDTFTALASRTGEGAADSADSGEEEKQSGGNG